MRVGVGKYIQSPDAISRSSSSPHADDASIYEDELHLSSLVEPLGFDSIWATDHYFTPYQMTGSALQQITFAAGRTSRLDFGTMAIILPWHHPLQVATEISVLDHLLGGRRLFVGVGRGSSPREYRSFGIDPTEAQARFAESLDVLMLALSGEEFSYEGEFIRLSPTVIRPRPRNPQRLIQDLLVASSNPRSRLMEGPGDSLGLLTMLTRPGEWREALQAINARRALRGWPATRPTVAGFCICTPSDEEGRRLINRHVAEYETSFALHYGSPQGPVQWLRSAARGVLNGIAESLGSATAAEAQIWGSPERCVRQLEDLAAALAPREVVLCFKFGDMSRDTAERSMRLFAENVLPVVQRWDVRETADGIGQG